MLLLGRAIEQAKKSGRIIAVLDVSKAFDIVPHEAIGRGLERIGVAKEVAEYVISTYKDCCTNIKTQDGEFSVKLRRGVKQGDPLSPLLFNLTIEPIIDEIQEKTSGLLLDGSNLAAMAFADDIVLMANDRQSAEAQIRYVHEQLSDRGMSLSIDKCAIFEYVARSKTWFIRDPQIRVAEEYIPYQDPEIMFKYLGVKVTPWKGALAGFEVGILRDLIKRIRCLPL